MGNASFLQSSFLGGLWSPNIQGNMANQAYKNALNVSENYLPTEEGALTRRTGTRFLGPTRAGAPGRLIAFDFSVVQPYQLEFTDGHMRVYAGLALVTYDPLNISAITATNPAKVVTTIAHSMATGDMVKFTLNQTPPPVPDLCNRQFVITKVDDFSFTLADAITNAAIDGTSWDYTTEPEVTDQVAKIFDLSTLWTGGDWSTLRAVSNEDNVLLLHTGIAPQVLSQGVTPDPFQLNAASFYDGPYLDINSTTTTVTPGGTSGSISLTFSAHAGINGGNGLASTDVGRLIRVQGGPAVWAVGTTYAKNAVVTGSDSNTYQSLAAGNVGNDPTTDGGVNWQLGTTGVTWTWMAITAVTDALHATATIKGPKLVNTDATPVWRLGVYSDTTGWPTAGAYHEGRLWLTGVIGNRIDGGTANNVDVITGQAMPVGTFNFAPTSPDGTVADDNGIAAIANAVDVNAIFWLASDSQGLILGTQAGEWIVKASTLDDPLTPTSIQMRRFSTYGCANIEQIRANRELIFVQRQGRKLLELGYYPYGEVAGYYAPNMAKFAENLTAKGIAEIRWQADQIPIVWARTNDNQLLGVTYKHAPASGMGTADTFTAWHGPHPFGHGREVTSIATGPAYDGLSQSLYMITNQPDNTKPDYNVSWVEVLTPPFDDAQADWASYFVDGGASPCAARKFLISNGDSFNGVRIYGLTYLNGQTITPVIGGLDLGDYTVANGYVDLDFGTPAAFTEAFFDEFETAAVNYGAFDTNYTFYVTSAGMAPPFPANNFGTFANAAETHPNNFSSVDIDTFNSVLYGFNTEDGFFDQFDFQTWVLKSSTDMTTGDFATYSSIANECMTYSPDGHVYTNGSISSTQYVLKVNPATLAVSAIATTGESGDWPDARQMVPFRSPTPNGGGTFTNYLGVVGITSISTETRVSVLVADTMTWGSQTILGVTTNWSWDIDEDIAHLVAGPIGSLYALGTRSSYSSGDTVGLYRIGTDLGFASFSALVKIAPADIDAGWTTFSTVKAPYWCSDDNTLILVMTSTGGGASSSYLVKYDPNRSRVVWKMDLTGLDAPAHPGPTNARIPLSRFWGWFDHEVGFYYVDLSNGTKVLHTFSQIFNAAGTKDGFYDTNDSSLTIFGTQASWSGTPPTPLGPYSTVHETSAIANGGTTKIYFGLDGLPTSHTVQFHAPTSAGFTYTSQGQLLRPDFGPDAGAQNGPAFGKKRRIHSATWGLYRTQALNVGTNLADLEPLKLQTDGGQLVEAPTLYSGILWDTINDDYGFTSQLSWSQTRPYPCLIQAIEGYIQASDK